MNDVSVRELLDKAVDIVRERQYDCEVSDERWSDYQRLQALLVGLGTAYTALDNAEEVLAR